MNTLSRLRPAARLLLACATIAAPLNATLLVYEGFNGYTTGALASQTPNANTVGLNQSVGYYDGAATPRTSGYTIQSAGLTLGSLSTGGGALRFTAGTSVIGADLSIGAAFTGTLWSSYLVNLTTKGTATTGDGFVVRVGEMPSESTNGHFNSFADSRNNSANIATGYGGTNSTPVSNNGNAGLTTGTTYIIINSFTRVGQALSVGSPGVSKIWALTEAQFSAFKLAGGDEAALNAASVTATATNTITSGNFSFSSTDAFGIVSVNDAGVVDELRFGSALADVTPSLIPEPGSAASLAGLAAFALLGLSRRRPKAR